MPDGALLADGLLLGIGGGLHVLKQLASRGQGVLGRGMLGSHCRTITTFKCRLGSQQARSTIVINTGLAR